MGASKCSVLNPGSTSKSVKPSGETYTINADFLFVSKLTCKAHDDTCLCMRSWTTMEFSPSVSHKIHRCSAGGPEVLS